MPTGDGRCSLCGYWHAPGAQCIGRAPDFPSEAHADRQLRALAKWGRAQENGYSEPEPPIPWAEFKQDYRKQLIDRAVGELTWPRLRADLANESPVNPSFLLIGLAQVIRARFAELDHG